MKLRTVAAKMTKGLKYRVDVKCGQNTRARLGQMSLKSVTGPGYVEIETPVFMPVGTNGTMKGILPEQVEATGCRLMLSNTYHLASRPGIEVIGKAGGLHKFMCWPHCILTDSGGFQMVSLSDLMTIDEDGVSFTSPYIPDQLLHLSPEKATQIQHAIGSNIVMQLDDVVSSTANDDVRFEEAMKRTIRWYSRCKEVHKEHEDTHNLFPIIQGGLNAELRRQCVEEMIKLDPPGIAVGGLSGGEEKIKFIGMVAASTEFLPDDKPRYLMGVGFAIDMLLCVAMGIDMFDCVFPTRTARFGSALVGYGNQIQLKNIQFANDHKVIDDECDCIVCSEKYTRSYLHHLMRYNTTNGCHLLTQHNIRFQMRFMAKIRDAIRNNRLADFILDNLVYHYGTKSNYPDWVQKGLDILKLDF